MVTARNTVDWSNHYLSWDYWSSVLSMSLIKEEEEEEEEAEEEEEEAELPTAMKQAELYSNLFRE